MPDRRQFSVGCLAMIVRGGCVCHTLKYGQAARPCCRSEGSRIRRYYRETGIVCARAREHVRVRMKGREREREKEREEEREGENLCESQRVCERMKQAKGHGRGVNSFLAALAIVNACSGSFAAPHTGPSWQTEVRASLCLCFS